MGKKRICHICNLGMNGKAIFLCNLLEHTDFEKYDVTILNYWAKTAEPIAERLKMLPVTIVTPPEKGGLAFCGFLNRFFRKNRFDVCHSHIWDLSGLFLAVAHRRKIPVRVAHSHNASKETGRYGKLKSFLRDKIIWNLLLEMIKIHANRYVACSGEAAKWLFRPSILRRSAYTIVPNGIDLEKFQNSERIRRTPTELLFAGRFVYQKNPLFAVNAFSEYLKTEPGAHLTMVGKGALDNEVRAEIERLGLSEQITIVPETKEMPEYYRKADLFLFPSHYEGLGIALIEAQTAGLRCLASDVVPKEVQCGLVEFKRLEDGASAWGAYIADLLQNETLHLDKSALSKYDAKNTANIIESVYEP